MFSCLRHLGAKFFNLPAFEVIVRYCSLVIRKYFNLGLWIPNLFFVDDLLVDRLRLQYQPRWLLFVNFKCYCLPCALLGSWQLQSQILVEKVNWIFAFQFKFFRFLHSLLRSIFISKSLLLITELVLRLLIRKRWCQVIDIRCSRH